MDKVSGAFSLREDRGSREPSPTSGLGPDGLRSPSEASLGEMVRAKRESEGLSLRDAAAISGVAFATIGRVENGGEPSLRVDRALRAWLNGELPAPITIMPPMSLRDWFAGQALASLLQVSSAPQPGESAYAGFAELAAADAYTFADAMLIERRRGGQP